MVERTYSKCSVTKTCIWNVSLSYGGSEKNQRRNNSTVCSDCLHCNGWALPYHIITMQHYYHAVSKLLHFKTSPSGLRKRWCRWLLSWFSHLVCIPLFLPPWFYSTPPTWGWNLATEKPLMSIISTWKMLQCLFENIVGKPLNQNALMISLHFPSTTLTHSCKTTLHALQLIKWVQICFFLQCFKTHRVKGENMIHQSVQRLWALKH